MLIAFARLLVDTAEKRTPHAPGRDVVIGRVRQADNVFTGSGHNSNVMGIVARDEAALVAKIDRYVPVQIVVQIVWSEGIVRICQSAFGDLPVTSDGISADDGDHSPIVPSEQLVCRPFLGFWR